MVQVSPINLTMTGDATVPWSLIDAVTFQDEIGTITVPKGFKTDLASVPRALWSILPPFGPYIPAAIIHDYLYVTPLVSRERADAIFLTIMRAYKVPRWKRITMYLAVRAFGWRHFKGGTPTHA